MNAVEVFANVVAENGTGPIQGGVQQSGALLDSEGDFSSGKDAGAVQQLAPLLDKLDGNGIANGPAQELIVSATSPDAGEPTAAATMGLPAPAVFGKAGRKAVITPQVAEQICMLLSVGFSRRQAAAYLGCSPMTITNAAARDPELAAELRRAEEISDIHPELTLMAAARKNWRAAAWYLTFKAKNPRPKTEEEKEAEHQQRLRDERRTAERWHAVLDGMTSRPAPSAMDDPATTEFPSTKSAKPPRKGERLTRRKSS